ncbi:unnamed protein product [Rhizophagus irregularis]|nr:unnamed protein product [Rhizophagus irregularis]
MKKWIVQKKKKSNSLLFHNEVEEYLAVSIESQSVNPCEWWNTISNLAKIVRDYICITATSVPSEQAFSKSGELISKRNRLGDHSIEARMCLNSWIGLLDSNKCI